MPAAAILEAVWDDLVDAIEAIRADDGYRTTVHTVTTDPVGLLAQSSQQTPFVQVLWDAERSRPSAGAFGDVDDTLVFAVEWRLDAPGLVEADRRQLLSDWRQDLEHALCVDVSRGGVAYDTEVADGPGGPWVDTQGTLLGSSTITVRVMRTRGAA